MNSFYNMWNMDYVQQQANAQQHHHEQQLQVAETARKLQDFLDSWDKIEPII